VELVCEEIDKIFGDNVGKECVLLSTIHKSKGREWDKVLWLQTGPSPWAKQDWEIEQEVNLCYVATTRAKKELVLA
jgi:DNA helicase-2/ATP-dependent DNA helicase PcrA